MEAQVGDLETRIVRIPARRRALSRALVAVLVATAPSSCGHSETGGSLPGSVATLQLAETPELRIGVTKGESAYLLSGVADATRLSDGSVVVADCMSAQVRYFDPAGRFIRSVGGTGDGPGEFAFLRRVFRMAGDTVGVVDMRRVTLLAPDGTVGGTTRMSALSVDILGALETGVLVGRRTQPGPLVRPDGHPRASTSLVLVSRSGEVVDSVSGLPASDAYPTTDPGGNAITGLRLQRTAVFAVQPLGTYYGGQDEAGIVQFDVSLREVQVIHPATRSEPVTNEVRRAYDAAARRGEHDAPMDDLTRGAPPPPDYAPVMPGFGDVVAGQDGLLWVQHPERPGQFPLTWTAYDGNAAVARVELPPRFFPFEFGRDWVLGVSFDELSVERIELWRLVPGALDGSVVPPRDARAPIPTRCGVWTSR